MTITTEKRDLFTMPQGYYLAHCISSDFALGAGIAKTFDSVYNMRFNLFRNYPDYKYNGGPDVIKVEMNITELTYEPGHIVDYDETGIRSTFNSWNFETDMPIYKYRPDQMRRNLKIQW